MPSRHWFERRDGAYVWLSRDTYYSNPMNPRCRMWQAFLYDGTPNGDSVSYRRRGSKLAFPRKWNTPEAAMHAVDREHPMQEEVA